MGGHSIVGPLSRDYGICLCSIGVNILRWVNRLKYVAIICDYYSFGVWHYCYRHDWYRVSYYRAVEFVVTQKPKQCSLTAKKNCSTPSNTPSNIVIFSYTICIHTCTCTTAYTGQIALLMMDMERQFIKWICVT